MMTKIYYSIMPHPAEDKWWGREIYSKIHFNESFDPITVSKDKFSHYWKFMINYTVPESNTYQEKLNHLWRVFNDGDHIANPNPLGTNKGQEIVRKSGTHHTSMSVGDVVLLDGKYWIVAGSGFIELRVK